MEYDQSFPPDPPSALAARRFVRDRLAGHGVATEDGELIVSELMGNVVRHARTPITVRLRVGRSLRLEVHDGSSILPAMAEAAEDAESGRGLFIISALAKDWGITRKPGGKFVWVELEREAG